MIAVALDPAIMRFAVAGRGQAAARRLLALRAGGAHAPLLFSDRPDETLIRAAGPALRNFLPGRPDLSPCAHSGLPACPTRRSRSPPWHGPGGVLVNVEDCPALCDFHSVAEVRRGDLLLTVSTGGASPGLAACIRARLASDFGPEWADRLALLRHQRMTWRRNGDDVAALTDALLHANGWLA